MVCADAETGRGGRKRAADAEAAQIPTRKYLRAGWYHNAAGDRPVMEEVQLRLVSIRSLCMPQSSA